MTPFVIVDKTTGRILKGIDGYEQTAIASCGDGTTYFANPNRYTSRTHYVNMQTGKFNARGMTPCTPNVTSLPADGQTLLKLAQMRDGTQISVSGPSEAQAAATGDNATYSFAFVQAGQYVVTATAPFPAMPKTIEIEAT